MKDDHKPISEPKEDELVDALTLKPREKDQNCGVFSNGSVMETHVE